MTRCDALSGGTHVKLPFLSDGAVDGGTRTTVGETGTMMMTAKC